MSLAVVLAAGGLVGTAAATPEDTFPQAPTKAEILRWLVGNSDLSPDAVVTMTDELVVAVTSRQDGRGVGRSTRLTLREEVINPDAAAAWGGRSIQLDLDLDCSRHRVILGARRIYTRPNLQGSAHITRSDNIWTEVPPDTVIDDVARAACSHQNPTQLVEALPAPRPSDSATVAAAAAVPPVQTAAAEPPPAPSAPAAQDQPAPSVKAASAEPAAAPSPQPPSPPASETAPAAPPPVKLAEAAPAQEPAQAPPPAPAPAPVHVTPPAPVPAPVHLALADPAPGPAPQALDSKASDSKASNPPPADVPPSKTAKPARSARPVKVAAADPPPAPPAAAPVTIVAPPADAVTVVATEPAAPPQAQAPAQVEPAPADQSLMVHNPFAVAENDKSPPAPPVKSAAPPAAKPTPRPAGPPPPRGPDVAVQIAAVASADLARDSWQALKDKLPSLVAPLTFAVEPVDANGRTLYRALLLGFASPDEAGALCKVLRSQSVDCVLRPMR